MLTPQDKEDLQRFLGVINFISPYIPNCADKAAPLRDLLKKEGLLSGAGAFYFATILPPFL